MKHDLATRVHRYGILDREYVGDLVVVTFARDRNWASPTFRVVMAKARMDWIRLNHRILHIASWYSWLRLLGTHFIIPADPPPIVARFVPLYWHDGKYLGRHGCENCCRYLPGLQDLHTALWIYCHGNREKAHWRAGQHRLRRQHEAGSAT